MTFETPLYDALVASIQGLLASQLTEDQKQTILLGETAGQIARHTDAVRTLAEVLGSGVTPPVTGSGELDVQSATVFQTGFLAAAATLARWIEVLAPVGNSGAAVVAGMPLDAGRTFHFPPVGDLNYDLAAIPCTLEGGDTLQVSYAQEVTL